MGPHGQSPWYLHEIPSYAKASEGYPPVAKSAEALILRRMNDPTKSYAFIHGQSPCLHAEVPRSVFPLNKSFGAQAWSSAQADKVLPATQQ